MSDAQRVIDEIGALVDEQLHGGEPETGYDYDDPDYPRCRCGISWHGLPAYVCPGSDAEGPLRSTVTVFETFSALAQAAEQMRQQFSESWSRLVETLVWGPVPLEAERFHLDQWVASHDWQAETSEEMPSFAAQVQELATRPVPPPTPMWAVDATRTRRSRHL